MNAILHRPSETLAEIRLGALNNDNAARCSEAVKAATGIDLPDRAALSAMPDVEIARLNRAMLATLAGILSREDVPKLGFHATSAERFADLVFTKGTGNDPLWVTASQSANPRDQLSDLLSCIGRSYGYRFPSGAGSMVFSPGPIAVLNLSEMGVTVWGDDDLVDTGELHLVRSIPDSALGSPRSRLDIDSPAETAIWGNLNRNDQGSTAQAVYRHAGLKEEIKDGPKEAKIRLDRGCYEDVVMGSVEAPALDRFGLSSMGGGPAPVARDILLSRALLLETGLRAMAIARAIMPQSEPPDYLSEGEKILKEVCATEA